MILRFLAKLVRPLVEEANRQTYAARSDEATTAGADGLERVWFMVFGDGPLGSQLSSQEQRSP